MEMEEGTETGGLWMRKFMRKNEEGEEEEGWPVTLKICQNLPYFFNLVSPNK
jgi:hypothetical protein